MGGWGEICGGMEGYGGAMEGEWGEEGMGGGEDGKWDLGVEERMGDVGGTRVGMGGCRREWGCGVIWGGEWGDTGWGCGMIWGGEWGDTGWDTPSPVDPRSSGVP